MARDLRTPLEHSIKIKKNSMKNEGRDSFLVTYKRRIKCSKAELRDQFTLAYNGKINELAREFRQPQEKKKPGITQVRVYGYFVFISEQ